MYPSLIVCSPHSSKAEGVCIFTCLVCFSSVTWGAFANVDCSSAGHGHIFALGKALDSEIELRLVDELQPICIVESHLRVLRLLDKNINTSIDKANSVNTQGHRTLLVLENVRVGRCIVATVGLGPDVEFVIGRFVCRKSGSQV